MRIRPVAVALLLAFAPAATTIPALAQSAADDPTTDMARARFKEGVGYYDKGQFGAGAGRVPPGLRAQEAIQRFCSTLRGAA